MADPAGHTVEVLYQAHYVGCDLLPIRLGERELIRVMLDLGTGVGLGEGRVTSRSKRREGDDALYRMRE